MNRAVWYPTLVASALYCAEPVLSHGPLGFPDSASRWAAVTALLLI